MSLSFRIARRYLFAKKSTNAINIITGISVLGVAIGTAALVLVLSVFNGFEHLITGLFSNFNPEVKITPARGKTFEPDSLELAQIAGLEGVAYISQTLEEVAFFEYKKSQDFGILKGVDENFRYVNGIDSTIAEGVFQLQKGERELAVLGMGMRNKLNVNVDDFLSPMKVYMPRRKKAATALEKPFRERLAYPAGTFLIQQDFDNQYVLFSLAFAQQILEAPGQVSSLELALKPDASTHQVVRQIQGILGPDFLVRDRYRQDEAFLKLMNIEKWLSFAILSLTLLLVAFNMIGSLWMIVLEKKKDIAILKSMGATDGMVRNIFLFEGLLLCLIGMVVGFAGALGLYYLHTNLENGLISIPQSFLITAYPIALRLVDFLVITLTVSVIGLIASIPPALKARSIPSIIQEQ